MDGTTGGPNSGCRIATANEFFRSVADVNTNDAAIEMACGGD